MTEPPAWRPIAYAEAGGTVRVDIVDEDGATLPIIRAVSQAQADRLVANLEAEQRSTGRPMKDLIRDPVLMAALILMVKRWQDPSPSGG